jgi:general secretion pathway protein A
MITTFFNLKDEPFRLTPDPRFLHLANTHGEVLGAVVQAILRRKGFVVVSGPIGAGKTTLLHAALQIVSQQSVSQAPITSAFIVNPLLAPDEFLETLLMDFEIPCSGTSKPARLNALHKAFIEAQRRGGTSVLLVDEAHLLSLELFEEIRLLTNVETYHEKLLQVVLCGQPELLPVLQLPRLRPLQQRVAVSCELRPLTFPETQAYIAERLRKAGLQGPSPFTMQSIKRVHEFSGGIPRLINLLCDSSLSVAYAQRKKQIDLAVIEEAEGKLDVKAPAAALELQNGVTNRLKQAEPGLIDETVNQLGLAVAPVVELRNAIASTLQSTVASLNTMDLLIDRMKTRSAVRD